MGVFDREASEAHLLGALPEAGGFRASSIKTKLLVTLIPTVVVMLMVTGYITYFLAHDYITLALERIARIQNLAMVNQIELFFENSIRDLRFIAQDPLDHATMRAYLAKLRAAGNVEYIGFGCIRQKSQEHVVLVANNDKIHLVPADHLGEVKPNPMALYDNIKDLQPGEVWISKVEAAVFPFPTTANANNRLSTAVVRFVMPYVTGDPAMSGYVYLTVDAREVRNILSLYHSAESPIYAFVRSPELRFSYLFNMEGWVLFQSEESNIRDSPLSTDLVRIGTGGVLGKPDLPNAFRPSTLNSFFWKMLDDVRENKQDLIRGTDSTGLTDASRDYYLAYAPVRYAPSPGKEKTIYGGLATVDRSRLTLLAGYRQLDVMLVVLFVAIVANSLLIYILSRTITLPIIRLSRAVKEIRATGLRKGITLPPSGYETAVLTEAINTMISTMAEQMEAIKVRDQAIETVNLKELALLELDIPDSALGWDTDPLPEIIGFGPKMDALKSDILKAARVDVDVLIVGETGTGKQLTAEAVHRVSGRAAKPFISINCGALDENLLLDTLFGHVRGAFTEAKTDRKGAFLEAQGGALFLDEIQSASPRVQQALLRVISMRKIKPLGSDQELDVDVRLITATNVDLTELITLGRFREDLYFRLKVITIHTPTLREQKANIIPLAVHCLRRAEQLAKKQGLGLSKGALERMKQYDWPGNVRELKNCMTRAVVMAEGKIIQAHEILLEGEKAMNGSLSAQPQRAVEIRKKKPVPPEPEPPEQELYEAALSELNQRQQRAYPYILAKGGVTRNEYLGFLGDLSSRTAVYDLQDLVRRGMLKKVGKGPATRYVAQIKS